MAFWKSLILTFALPITVLACAAHSTENEKSSPQTTTTLNDNTDSQRGSDNYPDIWWKPVPKDELASWEIGPQGADRAKGEVILSKRNELGMLSNFYAASFTFEGRKYASMEGLWQSLKYPEGPNDERLADPNVKWPFTRDQVENMTAFEAKDAGKIASENMKKLGIKWVTHKGQKIFYSAPGAGQQKHYEVIFGATVQKITQNEPVKSLLLKTGTLNLLPDHAQEPGTGPAYAYFTIAMKIRTALQKGETPKP